VYTKLAALEAPAAREKPAISWEIREQTAGRALSRRVCARAREPAAPVLGCEAVGRIGLRTYLGYSRRKAPMAGLVAKMAENSRSLLHELRKRVVRRGRRL